MWPARTIRASLKSAEEDLKGSNDVVYACDGALLDGRFVRQEAHGNEIAQGTSTGNESNVRLIVRERVKGKNNNIHPRAFRPVSFALRLPIARARARASSCDPRVHSSLKRPT